MTAKNILITGATSDIGKATALRLAPDAGCLYLHGRNRDKLAQLSESLPCETVRVVCDLTDDAAITDRFSSLKNIDIVINNAGGALGQEKAHEADFNDWDVMLQTNVRSLMQITNMLLPEMVKRRSGYIINIGSVAGNWPYPGGHVYCAAKAFVRQFSLAMRADLLGSNVRVSNIEPGAVETSFSLKRFKGDTEKAKAVYENLRALQPEDIANTIAFLMSQPDHVNITSLEIMPTDQANGPFQFYRG